jgi:hypothetical protein
MPVLSTILQFSPEEIKYINESRTKAAGGFSLWKVYSLCLCFVFSSSIFSSFLLLKYSNSLRTCSHYLQVWSPTK